MSTFHTRWLPLLVLLLAFAATEAQAQSVSELERSRYNQAAFYRYAEQADVTIQVSAWGAMQNPGLYEIPRGTSLRRFFSIAGGPNIGTLQHGQEQRLSVRLSRDEGDGTSVVFEQEMENAVLTFDEDVVLQDGDVLTVERYTRQRFTWRDILPVVSTAASVGSTIIVLLSR